MATTSAEVEGASSLRSRLSSQQQQPPSLRASNGDTHLRPPLLSCSSDSDSSTAPVTGSGTVTPLAEGAPPSAQSLNNARQVRIRLYPTEVNASQFDPPRLVEPKVRRTPSRECLLRGPDFRGNESDSSVKSNVSGVVAPVLEDASASANPISHSRQVRKRLFPTVLYEHRVSHFDPQSKHHDFRGFFALFWIGLFILVITTGLRNLRDTGKVLGTSIFSLFMNAPLELGFAELAMIFSTSICLPLQQVLQQNGAVAWEKSGYIAQHFLQTLWLGVWVYLPFYLEWQWTHQVFFTMHALVLLMKIHSYSFYCGHLSECYKKLRALDKTTASNREQMEHRRTLAFELTSPDGKLCYPQNLTLRNFVDYMLCPTLCYELSYPRTARIRWSKVAEKVVAVFGCIFLLTVVSEEFILPVMKDASVSLEKTQVKFEIILILLESISLLLFPFMITFLLVFLVIFEYVLGAFAEITRFGDRHFYSDWWNSTDWLEFSRQWNIPVHRFLQRHVYGVSLPHMSRPLAKALTFLISALAHELVLFCITQKFRGYGFVCQMLQIPMMELQRTEFMKKRRTFNNVMFWFSMIYGLSMISALYVLM